MVRAHVLVLALLLILPVVPLGCDDDGGADHGGAGGTAAAGGSGGTNSGGTSSGAGGSAGTSSGGAGSGGTSSGGAGSGGTSGGGGGVGPGVIVLDLSLAPSTDEGTSWTDQGVDLSLTDWIGGGYGAEMVGDCIRLHPAMLFIWLISLSETIHTVEVDVTSSCAPGCTQVLGFISGPMVDDASSTQVGVEETLTIEYADGFNSVHVGSDDAVVCGIRLYY